MKQENVGINSSFSRMPALVRESVNSLQPAIYLVSFWWLVVKNKKNTISAGSTFWKTTQKRTLRPIMNGLKMHWSSGTVFCQIRPQFNGHLCTFGQNPPNHHHSDHHDIVSENQQATSLVSNIPRAFSLTVPFYRMKKP